MPFRATFRSSELKSEAAALALRKQKSEEYNHAMTQQLNYGKFLLASQQQANEQAMAEVKIKSDLKKQSEVSWALKEISNLDPTAPDYLGRYAGIMANAPMAADNKFLNEHFKEQADVNRAAMAAKVAKEHIDYSTDAAIYRHGVTKGMDIEAHGQQKAIDVAAKTRDVLIAAAVKNGVDLKQFMNENGGFDFAGISTAVSTSVGSVPTNAAIGQAIRIRGQLAKSQAKFDAFKKNMPSEDATPASRESHTRAMAEAQGEIAGAKAEQEAMQSQFGQHMSSIFGAGINQGQRNTGAAPGIQQPAQPQAQLGQPAQQPQPSSATAQRPQLGDIFK